MLVLLSLQLLSLPQLRGMLLMPRLILRTMLLLLLMVPHCLCCWYNAHTPHAAHAPTMVVLLPLPMLLCHPCLLVQPKSGLPQPGALAAGQPRGLLGPEGYIQSKHTPGVMGPQDQANPLYPCCRRLWSHVWGQRRCKNLGV